MFKHITGADIIFVPYKSAAQATTDVLSGQMNMTFEGTTAIVPFIKSGQVRALAVTSPHRIPEIPDVPTMDELGYPGMPPDSWQAIVAPAHTPPEIVARINAAVNQGLATSAIRNRIIGLGGEPRPMSVADFAAFIVAQYQRWGEVIRITGVDQLHAGDANDFAPALVLSDDEGGKPGDRHRLRLAAETDDLVAALPASPGPDSPLH